MSVLLHISDTHFGTEQPEVVEALLRLAAREPVDVVLWSGDITQRATAAEFAAARDFGERLRAPALRVIPGNHDIPLFDLLARATRPYAQFSRAFGPELEPEYAGPDVLVVMLNTTRTWRHRDGEVSAAQLQRSAARLASAGPGQLRVVVVHQPVGVLVPSDRHNLMHGHEAAVQAWQAAGADLVLGGHIHLPYVMALGRGDGLWAVQAGTAVSRRRRSGLPNSVNLIRYQAAEHDRHCTVERWDFLTGEGEFRQQACTRLALRPHDAEGVGAPE
ncbi:MAG: metallophosphoesterase [Pseudomonadota bacterium]